MNDDRRPRRTWLLGDFGLTDGALVDVSLEGREIVLSEPGGRPLLDAQRPTVQLSSACGVSEFVIRSTSDLEPRGLAAREPMTRGLLRSRDALVAFKGPLGGIPRFRRGLSERVKSRAVRDAVRALPHARDDARLFTESVAGGDALKQVVERLAALLFDGEPLLEGLLALAKVRPSEAVTYDIGRHALALYFLGHFDHAPEAQVGNHVMDRMIQQIDAWLSVRLVAMLGDPAFRRRERAWRTALTAIGLDLAPRLVQTTNDEATLEGLGARGAAEAESVVLLEPLHPRHEAEVLDLAEHVARTVGRPVYVDLREHDPRDRSELSHTYRDSPLQLCVNRLVLRWPYGDAGTPTRSLSIEEPMTLDPLLAPGGLVLATKLIKPAWPGRWRDHQPRPRVCPEIDRKAFSSLADESLGWLIDTGLHVEVGGLLDPSVALEQAVERVEEGRNAKARELLLALNPALLDPSQNLTRCYYEGLTAFRLGMLDEAEVVLHGAHAEEPAHFAIIELIARVNMARGHAALKLEEPATLHFRQALNYYQRARALNRNEPRLDYCIARMASRVGSHDEMLEALARAFTADQALRPVARLDADILCSIHVPGLAQLLED